MKKSFRFFEIIEKILSQKDDVEGRYKISISGALKMVLGLEPFIVEIEKEDIKEILMSLFLNNRLFQQFESSEEASAAFDQKLNNFVFI